MGSRSVVQQILAQDLSFVKEKFIADHPNLKSRSDALLLELKRWMALCLINPQKVYSMRGPVDKMWHTFILFTHDYRRFCYTYGAFVHHFPELPSDRDEADENGINYYEVFLADYRQEFGKVDHSIWPLASDLKAQPQCQAGGSGNCRNCQHTCHRQRYPR